MFESYSAVPRALVKTWPATEWSPFWHRATRNAARRSCPRPTSRATALMDAFSHACASIVALAIVTADTVLPSRLVRPSSRTWASKKGGSHVHGFHPPQITADMFSRGLCSVTSNRPSCSISSLSTRWP
jgi:hypothetical protein